LRRSRRTNGLGEVTTQVNELGGGNFTIFGGSAAVFG
jgi:hypothetical protein